MTSKQANSKEMLTFMLQGLLAGTAGMSAIQLAKHLKGLQEKSQTRDIGITGEHGSLDEVQLKKTASGIDAILQGGWNDAKSVTSKAVNAVTEPAASNVGRNAALLLSLALGGYGVSQAWDRINLGKARKEADQTKEYYYSRLMDAAEKGDYTADATRTPLLRKEAAATGVSAADFATFLMLGGIPFGTAYVVKRYLDETMPGTKQPAARPSEDLKGRVSRVRVLPDTDKEVQGVAKLASAAPAVERAFELAHVYRTVLGHTKHASKTLLPDMVDLITAGRGRELKKVASEENLDTFIDWVAKESAGLKKSASSPRATHLAVDLLASDYELASMVRPIVFSEFAEAFPTAIKTASVIDREFAEFGLLMAKLETLDIEQHLFSPSETLTKKASAEHNLSAYSEQLLKAFESEDITIFA